MVWASSRVHCPQQNELFAGNISRRRTHARQFATFNQNLGNGGIFFYNRPLCSRALCERLGNIRGAGLPVRGQECRPDNV